MSSKLREALSEIIDTIDKWRTNGAMEHWQYSQLYDIADAALAEPVLNCEVGSAEEQYNRFDKICSGTHATEDCPLFEKTSPCCSPYCFARWAQMLYESEVK